MQSKPAGGRRVDPLMAAALWPDVNGSRPRHALVTVAFSGAGLTKPPLIIAKSAVCSTAVVNHLLSDGNLASSRSQTWSFREVQLAAGSCGRLTTS